MKKRILQVVFLFVLFPMGLWAQKTVTGVIKDDTGSPLPGANVLVVGTMQGTVADANGHYSIQVPGADAVLRFSFVGMQPQEIKVGDQTVINVTLRSESLSEIVVTALGITREAKSLGYSVGEVKGDDLQDVPHENVLTGLAGRVSGVSVSSTSATPGSSVSIVIRGATSLAGDNQPLFVIDGVPVNNSLRGNTVEIGRRNVVDYGNAISDLNAEDIESISILKGPSAAALYGSRAGNGVVLITTKSGKKGKKYVSVNLSSSVLFDAPYKFYQKHNLFATGVRPTPPPGVDPPVIEEDGTYAMGLPLDKGFRAIAWNSPLDSNGNPIPVELVSHPNNDRDFVQTGVTNENNISFSGGAANSAYRVSFTNLQSRGVIPNSDFHKNGLNLSGSYDLSDKITVSTNLNVGKTYSNNRPAGNRGANPLHALLYTPAHIDINDLKEYWMPGQEEIQQRSLPDHNNPYFLAYAVNNNFFRDRVFGNMKLTWKILPGLKLEGSFNMDRYNEQRESKIPKSYIYDKNGVYGLQKIYHRETNTNVLLTYDKKLGDLSVNASAGGNWMYRYYNISSMTTKQRGAGLIVPGLYNVSNIDPLSLVYRSYWSQKAIYSVYGMASIGYKSIAYLDLTARNDWSSTLPPENRSYFYPSASLSVLLNNMIPMPSTINLFKVRAGWAQVGNDTDPYRLESTLSLRENWGGLTRMDTPSNLLSPNLKPEIATSLEFGADVALMDNRLRLSLTHYNVDNKNQILSVRLPMSSGYSSKLINAGLVEGRGWEASLGITPVKTSDLKWDLNFVFSRNRTKITELAEGIDYYKLWSDAKGGAYTFVGEDIGVLRDRSLKKVTEEFLRENGLYENYKQYIGWLWLDDEGYHDYESKDPAHMDIIGNFNPNFTLGLQTSITYKRFRLNMNFDWRNGGEFVSQTYRYTESDLISKRFMDFIINPNKVGGDIVQYIKDHELYKGINIVGGPTEDRGGYLLDIGGWVAHDGVFNPGVRAEYDNDGNVIGFVENIGDDVGYGGNHKTQLIPLADDYPWSFTRFATFAADFIKLREVSLSYDIPINKGIKTMSLAVYSRNLILWTKAKVNIDPENAFQPENGTFKQGIERYNVNPWTIPLGFKVNLNF